MACIYLLFSDNFMGLFDNDTLFAESYYYYQDANEQQSAPGARKREFKAA